MLEWIGYIFLGVITLTLTICIVYTVYSFIYYQFTKKKLHANLLEAEEKIQKALYKINNAGVDRAKED